MSSPVLATKLFVPPLRPGAVVRFRLLERLNQGLTRKLTLVCAPAGFGKTSLLSEWLVACPYPSAWLSLDARDGDSNYFLKYVIAALQSIDASLGASVRGMLQSSHPPSSESILTVLINEISKLESDFVLVLDDYHLIAAKPIDDAVSFLLEHLPVNMHLVMVTREEPSVPLARLRVCGQLTELRQADLRFTLCETTNFLKESMSLELSAPNIAALEAQTEGWIAGLQLAAISLQGHDDATGFIGSFTGSNRFVQDYLLEEVLRQQPQSVQSFLLCTSILERFSASLCDAVLQDNTGQKTLEYLEQANLFIVPLDSDRRWYRYHHLFADLLRQRLQQTENAAKYHVRASQWFEDNGLEIEAFHQAALANDIPRVIRLIEGAGMPLYFRGVTTPVLGWLQAQSSAVLNANPSLWLSFAWSLMMSGKPSLVKAKLQAAEALSLEVNPETTDLLGQISALRSLLAAAQNNTALIVPLATHALKLLHSSNLPVRTAVNLTLGVAYRTQGDVLAASQAFSEVISTGQSSGNVMFSVAASVALGGIQELDNQFHLALETYQRGLTLIGDPNHLVGCEIHLGLARIFYAWNDLETAEVHLRQSLKLAAQLECSIVLAAELLEAQMLLARDELAAATRLLNQSIQTARSHQFKHKMAELAAVLVQVLLRQGDLIAAAQLADEHRLCAAQARVFLVRGDALAASKMLESQSETTVPLKTVPQKTVPQKLELLVLWALAHDANGKLDKALLVLQEALILAASAGLIRVFVNEGQAMAKLLSKVATQGIAPNFIAKLKTAFEARYSEDFLSDQSVFDSLSTRELEVLRLITQGLSNQEISQRLFRALSTVKWHNQKIFDKLQVQSRTEAIVRARELNLV